MGKPFRPKLSRPLRRWPTPKELIRFLSFVEIGEKIPEGQTEPCWLWKGYRDEKGYGQFHFDGCMEWSHRFGYQALKHMMLPPGIEAHHECLNSGCVNPNHLSPATKLENVAEGNSRRSAEREPDEDEREEGTSPVPVGEDAPF